MPPIIPAANGTKFILFIKLTGLNSPVYSEIPHHTKRIKTTEAHIPDNIPLSVNMPAAINPAKKQHSERITYIHSLAVLPGRIPVCIRSEARAVSIINSTMQITKALMLFFNMSIHTSI